MQPLIAVAFTQCDISIFFTGIVFSTVGEYRNHTLLAALTKSLQSENPSDRLRAAYDLAELWEDGLPALMGALFDGRLRACNRSPQFDSIRVPFTHA